jgi:hypothetical protein
MENIPTPERQTQGACPLFLAGIGESQESKPPGVISLSRSMAMTRLPAGRVAERTKATVLKTVSGFRL